MFKVKRKQIKITVTAEFKSELQNGIDFYINDGFKCLGQVLECYGLWYQIMVKNGF